MHSRRRWPWLCGLALSATMPLQPNVARAASAQVAPYCQPGQSPAFQPDFAPLAAQLGAYMGDPVECEHLDPSSGDTVQTTTTGLAYVRSALNAPVFTDGDSHVAWDDQGLTGWDGPSVDAPLHLTLGGRFPTWCDAETFGAGVAGFLCIYADQNVAAWSSSAESGGWLLLGTEASPDAEWMLTGVGRAILGTSLPPSSPPSSSMPAPPAAPLPSQPAPTPSLAPPLDSDLEVSIQPVSPSPPPSFPLITGSVCNRSSVWTATDVEISFTFSEDPLTPTNDHGGYTVASVPPNACQPIVTSLSALYSWNAITPSIASVSWRR